MFQTQNKVKWNLENVFVDSIFLAPKVYGGKLEDGTEIIKIKGLSHKTIKNDVTLSSLKLLLVRNKSLVFNQIKSFKKYDDGTINLLEQSYNLVTTENKRKLIYNHNNMLIYTNPFSVSTDKNDNIFINN